MSVAESAAKKCLRRPDERAAIIKLIAQQGKADKRDYEREK